MLCCSASTKPIQRGLFHSVVDVIERASTPDYSFLQLRLETDISKYFSYLKSAYQLLQYFI